MVYLRIEQVYFYDAISLVYMKNASNLIPRVYHLPALLSLLSPFWLWEGRKMRHPGNEAERSHLHAVRTYYLPVRVHCT